MEVGKMANKKTNKPLVYVIDEGNEVRSAKAVIQDMERCDICILLGNEKTHQMWKEEKIAWRLGMAIFYRPAQKTFDELLISNDPIFPIHQQKL